LQIGNGCRSVGTFTSEALLALPDRLGAAFRECVDLFWLSTHDHSPIFVLESDKLRLIVLQNELSGQTVALGYVSQSTNFDEFAPEAQKVIDTIEWGDS
jgi:hypothetical protein